MPLVAGGGREVLGKLAELNKQAKIYKEQVVELEKERKRRRLVLLKKLIWVVVIVLRKWYLQP